MWFEMHLAREGSNFHAQIEYDLYIMNSEIGSSYFKLQTEGKMRRLKKLGESKIWQRGQSRTWRSSLDSLGDRCHISIFSSYIISLYTAMQTLIYIIPHRVLKVHKKLVQILAGLEMRSWFIRGHVTWVRVHSLPAIAVANLFCGTYPKYRLFRSDTVAIRAHMSTHIVRGMDLLHWIALPLSCQVSVSSERTLSVKHVRG